MHLLEALKTRILLCDGAMGTQLQAAGIEPGECGDRWNLEHPDRVLAIHRAYAAAGADCLVTNSFGASRIMLERHGCADQTSDINAAAVRLAREALEALEDLRRSPGFVLGDIGPFGGMLEPPGDTPAERVRDAFDEQAAVLVQGGVDAILIETQTSLEELGLAVAAARAAGAPCVLASLAYDVTHAGTDLRTMMGVAPEDAARFVRDAGADVIGLNCGTGVDMEWAARAVTRYRATVNLPVIAQVNAGQPELENFTVVYKQSPEDMARGLGTLLDAGVAIAGGCCGTTPAHIATMRRVLDSRAP